MSCKYVCDILQLFLSLAVLTVRIRKAVRRGPRLGEVENGGGGGGGIFAGLRGTLGGDRTSFLQPATSNVCNHVRLYVHVFLSHNTCTILVCPVHTLCILSARIACYMFCCILCVYMLCYM